VQKYSPTNATATATGQKKSNTTQIEKKKNISTHLFGVFWQWGQFAQQTAPTAGRIDKVHFHLFRGGEKMGERYN
jgi:hypothetical protein